MQGMTIKAALFKLRAFIALIFIFSFFAFKLASKYIPSLSINSIINGISNRNDIYDCNCWY